MEDINGFDTHQRISRGLLVFARGYRPFVEAKMQAVFGPRWIEWATVARGSNPKNPLDAYGLLKTTLDRSNEVFRDFLKPPVRNSVFLALDARNVVAHNSEPIPGSTAITYLNAMTLVIAAVGEKDSLPILEALIEEQVRAMALRLGMGQPTPTPSGPQPTPEPRPTRPPSVRREVLRFEFDPGPPDVFMAALLRTKRAMRTIHYQDGHTEDWPWNASKLTETSILMDNLRTSRLRHWRRDRISWVEVKIIAS